MTETTTTTRHNAEATRRFESAVLDVQGVQAIIDVFAWAEDSLPVDLSGESRRVAFMLLSGRLGEAVNDLQCALEKGALDPKPEPKTVDVARAEAGPADAARVAGAPAHADLRETIQEYVDRRIAEEVPKHLDRIRASLEAIVGRKGATDHG